MPRLATHTFAAVAASFSIAALLCLRADTTLHAASFTVTSADDHDDGVCDAVDCTLREAMYAAMEAGGPNVIGFNIPGPGVHTIRPDTWLPIIFGDLTIDGYTQPGSSPNTLAVGDNAVLLIEIDG